MATKPIKIQINGDDRNLRRTLDGASGKIRGFASTAGTALLGLGAVGALAAGKIAKDGIAIASDVEESTSKVMNLFDDLGQRFVDLGPEVASTLGLSERAYLDTVGMIGNAITGVIDDTEEAYDITTDLIQSSVDLASFHNATLEDTSSATLSAIRGSWEPIQRYFPQFTESFTKEYGILNGFIDENTKKLDTNQRSLILHAMLMDEEVNPALGDFADTSEGAANQLRIMQANAENLKGEIGEKLLPIWTRFLEWMNTEGFAHLENFIAFVEDDVIPVLDDMWTVVKEDLWPVLKSWLEWLRTDGLDALKEVWGFIEEDLWPVLEGWIEWLRGDGLDGLKEVAGWIDETFIDTLVGTGDAVDGKEGVVERFRNWIDQMDLDLNPILEATDGYVTTLKASFEDVKDFIEEESGPAWDRLSDVMGRVRDILGGGGDEEGKGLVPIIVEDLIPAFINLQAAFLEDITPIIEFLARGLIEAALGNLEKFVTQVEDAITVVEKVGEAYDDMLSFFEELPQKIKDAGDSIKENIPTPQGIVSQFTGWAGGLFSGGRRYADGTSSTSAGLHLVGERGPEMVQLPAGSQVFPNDAGGMGTTNVFNLQTSADPQAIAREVSWLALTSGR